MPKNTKNFNTKKEIEEYTKEMEDIDQKIKILEHVYNNIAPVKRNTKTFLKFNENKEPIFYLPQYTNFYNYFYISNPNLDHAYGSLHGGMISYLLDCACWFVCALKKPLKTTILTTASLNVNFLLGLSKKDCYCIGKLEKEGKNIMFSKAYLYDEDDKLIATATAIIHW